MSLSTGAAASNFARDETQGGQAYTGIVITRLNSRDVLMGRGAPLAYYEGNVSFRDEVVRPRKAEYCSSKSQERKQVIAREVYDEVKRSGGRFLAKWKTPDGAASVGDKAWYVVDDSVALEKIKQALREKCAVDDLIETASTAPLVDSTAARRGGDSRRIDFNQGLVREQQPQIHHENRHLQHPTRHTTSDGVVGGLPILQQNQYPAERMTVLGQALQSSLTPTPNPTLTSTSPFNAFLPRPTVALSPISTVNAPPLVPPVGGGGGLFQNHALASLPVTDSTPFLSLQMGNPTTPANSQHQVQLALAILHSRRQQEQQQEQLLFMQHQLRLMQQQQHGPYPLAHQPAVRAALPVSAYPYTGSSLGSATIGTTPVTAAMTALAAANPLAPLARPESALLAHQSQLQPHQQQPMQPARDLAVRPNRDPPSSTTTGSKDALVARSPDTDECSDVKPRARKRAR